MVAVHCSNLFQLVDIFGNLLDRPIIKEIFDPYYPRLVTFMDEELNDSKTIYDNQMEKRENDGVPPVHQNFPKVRWHGKLRNLRNLFVGVSCNWSL